MSARPSLEKGFGADTEMTLETCTRSSTRIRAGRNIASGAIAGISDRIFTLADENAARLHPEILAQLAVRGPVERIASGEKSKNFDCVVRLVNRLAELRFTRSDSVLALGGGVVTDLAGFVASVYLRGIGYHSLPSTLLAMVDASIGGKCGVDLAAGKNLAGAFYQPASVTADAVFLDTLPQAEIENGLGEIIKYAVIADESLFGLLEDFGKNADEIVFRCMKIKCDVVAADERESGARMILNFGHTVGHAIEKIGGFEKYAHGRAVANGMLFESRILEAAGLVRASDTAKIKEAVDRFHLRICDRFEGRVIFDCMKNDKKLRGETLHFAGFETLGTGKMYAFGVEEAENLVKRVFGE